MQIVISIGDENVKAFEEEFKSQFEKAPTEKQTRRFFREHAQDQYMDVGGCFLDNLGDDVCNICGDWFDGDE